MDAEEREIKKINKQMQDDINHIVNEIYKHSSPKILVHLVGELETLKEYAQNVGFDIKVPYIYRAESSKLNKVYDLYYAKLLNHFEEMYRTNKQVSYNVNSVFDENGKLPTRNYYRTKVDATKLAGEFLKYFDKDIYDYYVLELTKNHYFDWTIEPNYLGITINLNSINKSYVMINNILEENILKASVIVHETIHSYFNFITKNNTNEEKSREEINYLYEVYPIFSQFVFVDWLRKIKFKDSDIKVLDNNLKVCLQSYANIYAGDLYSLEKYIDKFIVDSYYKNEGELENMENAIATSKFLKGFDVDISPDDIMADPDRVKIDFDYPGSNVYSCLASIIESDAYFYGNLLALHFLDQYRNNKEKAKDNITRFTLDSGKYKKQDLLDGYGLGLDNIKSKSRIKTLIYTKDCYK